MNAPDRPLEGLGVVITRPRVAADALARDLARAGARPFVFPALAIDPAPSPGLDAALDRLPACGLAIFISANAVQMGLAAARSRGPWPAAVRVAAVGEATAQELRNSGFVHVISPSERHDSEALLALDALKNVDGLEILIFRGEGGRELIRQTLEARGARVQYAECYRRVRPVSDPGPLLAAWSRGEIQAVSVLSAETLENFVAMVGASAPLRDTALVVPHAAIAAHPEARRFARVLVSPHGHTGLENTLASLRSAR